MAAAPKPFREVGKWTVSPCKALAVRLLQAMPETVELAASVAGCGRFVFAAMRVEPEHQ